MKITKKALKKLKLDYELLLCSIDLYSDVIDYYKTITKKLIWINERLNKDGEI